MDLTLAGGLAVLALVDSTSMGTLVIPGAMLVQQRVRTRNFMVYLATLCTFYFALGVALLSGAAWLMRTMSELGQSRPFMIGQLVVGIALIGTSFLIDKEGRAWRARMRERLGRPPAERRRGEWKQRLIGPDARVPTVMGLALLAGLIEAASMLPYLAAITMLSAATITLTGKVLTLVGYVVVMVVPALLLLALRLALRDRIAGPLQRLHAWGERNQGEMLAWVIGIVGILLAVNAWGALN